MGPSTGLLCFVIVRVDGDGTDEDSSGSTSGSKRRIKKKTKLRPGTKELGAKRKPWSRTPLIFNYHRVVDDIVRVASQMVLLRYLPPSLPSLHANSHSLILVGAVVGNLKYMPASAAPSTSTSSTTPATPSTSLSSSSSSLATLATTTVAAAAAATSTLSSSSGSSTAPSNDETAPTFLSVTVSPSLRPPRHLCSVCGFVAAYTCQQCSARFCSVRCDTEHKAARCNRFTA